MEINNVSGAYTSAAKVTETDDEKETKKAQEEEAKEAKVGEKDEKDTIEISQDDDYGESGIEEKAKNYVANILANTQLTDESRALIQQYMATFDAARFIKMYGPFTSTAEVSAAMYAITSHMVKYQQQDE